MEPGDGQKHNSPKQITTAPSLDNSPSKKVAIEELLMEKINQNASPQ